MGADLNKECSFLYDNTCIGTNFKDYKSDWDPFSNELYHYIMEKIDDPIFDIIYIISDSTRKNLYKTIEE
jgi:hypothetical protein